MGAMMPGLRAEIRPMVALAFPVVLAEIGWSMMGLVDIFIVGAIGPAAIGAVGLGSIVFLACGIFGMGLLLGLDTLVAQSFGAGRIDRCHHWLYQGVYLALLASLPLTAVLWGIATSLPAWKLSPEVLVLAVPYLKVVSVSVAPLLLYTAFRRYLQAMNTVRPITFALLSANVVNAIIGWGLVYGRFGLPALGAVGTAWATVLSRIYMACVLLLAIRLRERRTSTGLAEVNRRMSWAGLRSLLRLGLPASLQLVFEVGVFAVATALVSRLAATALAAHQIALNLWSFVFMLPLGLNAAGAVRVGQAVGRRDQEGVRRAGWTALALGVACTAGSALVFLTAGRLLVAAFSRDAAVLAIGPSLLAIAGVCLVFDATQTISTGILRGLGETRLPMLANLVGHWAIGLPLGYAACFWWGWGVQGLWMGLGAGLTVVGLTLVVVWARRVGALPGATGVSPAA
jgi:MATE family multidrug resistance protein